MNKIAKAGLIALLTNASAFCTVAMEKTIGNYDATEAAVTNSISSVPLLYRPGFDLGHRVFYHDSDFMRTAERVLKKG